MVVLGLSTRLTSGKPVISCIVLEGSRDSPRKTQGYELKTSATEIVFQIEDLCGKLSSQLSGLRPDAVVIRVADMAPSASRTNGPRYRLMIEGALAFVCRDHKVAEVVYRNGKECGEALDVNKSSAMSLGEAVDSKRAEAAAAALSALP
jgi:hypothetical protein